MAIRIVVAGEIFIDQVLSGFSAWPQPGEEAFATSLVRELGGGAAHTAAGLARLGWDVALAGPFGGAEGVWIQDRLAHLGLGADYLQEAVGECTGTTVAISSPHERTFFTYAGANKLLAATLLKLPTGGHLHLACPCEAATLRNLAAQFATVSLDAGWHPNWLRDPELLEALALVSWFLPNEREAACLTGESSPEAMLHRMHERGIRAAIKLGPLGSALRTAEGAMLMVPSITVQPIDTTGAGDNFNAGFLDAWLSGKSLEDCLHSGNILGALSTREMGGMNGFPTKEELQAWLSR